MELICTNCKKVIFVKQLNNNQFIPINYHTNETTGKTVKILDKNYITFYCPLCNKYNQIPIQ